MVTAANTVIAERIKHVEGEYEVETDDECGSETYLSLPQAGTYNKLFAVESLRSKMW